MTQTKIAQQVLADGSLELTYQDGTKAFVRPAYFLDVNGNPLFAIGNPAVVSQGAVQAVSSVLQNAQAANNTGAAFACSGNGVAEFEVTGSGVGMVTFQGLPIGATTWVNLAAQMRGSGTLGSSTTTLGVFTADINGMASVRATTSNMVSGTFTVKVACVPGTFFSHVQMPIGSPLLLWDGPAIAVPAGFTSTYPAWTNTTAAGTVVNVDIPLPKSQTSPANHQYDAIYAIVIQNPSTTSGITCNVRNAVVFNGGATLHANLDGASNPNASGTVVGSGGTPLQVAASTPAPVCFLVQGWMIGSGGRLSMSNDQVIADGSTVTVSVQVWRIG